MVVSTDGYGVRMLRKVGIEITKFSNFKNPFGKALNDEEFKERNSFTDKGMTASTYLSVGSDMSLEKVMFKSTFINLSPHKK